MHVDKTSLTQSKPTINYIEHSIRFVDHSAHPAYITGYEMRSNNLQECNVIHLYKVAAFSYAGYEEKLEGRNKLLRLLKQYVLAGLQLKTFC